MRNKPVSVTSGSILDWVWVFIFVACILFWAAIAVGILLWFAIPLWMAVAYILLAGAVIIAIIDIVNTSRG